MDWSFYGFVRGFAYLLWLNFKHYLFALWGVRLRLDPDYPNETRFIGQLIVDSVLEYRMYGLFAPWCAFLALLPPWPTLTLLAVPWAFLAFQRTYFYTTAFRFWTEAYHEAPYKTRNRTRYAEQIALEIERRMKAGAAWHSPELQELIHIGMTLQNSIIERKK